jgi:hypothetical protein
MAAAASAAEPRDPDLTIADGRQTVGFLFDNDDGTVSAADPDGRELGTFAKRAEARAAIIANLRGRQ